MEGAAPLAFAKYNVTPFAKLEVLAHFACRRPPRLPQGSAQLLVFEDRLEPLQVLLVRPAHRGNHHRCAAILPKPLGSPAFRSVMRVPPDSASCHEYVVCIGNGPCAVLITNRSSGTISRIGRCMRSADQGTAPRLGYPSGGPIGVTGPPLQVMDAGVAAACRAGWSAPVSTTGAARGPSWRRRP